MHVLIADDDGSRRTVLSRTLQQWELDVTVVADGAEALAPSAGGAVERHADAGDPRLDDAASRRRRRVPARPTGNAAGQHVSDAADLARKPERHRRGARCGRRRLPREAVRPRRAARARQRRRARAHAAGAAGRARRRTAGGAGQRQAAARPAADLQLLQAYPRRRSVLDAGRVVHRRSDPTRSSATASARRARRS